MKAPGKRGKEKQREDLSPSQKCKVFKLFLNITNIPGLNQIGVSRFKCNFFGLSMAMKRSIEKTLKEQIENLRNIIENM
jgi:hypothetical protein